MTPVAWRTSAGAAARVPGRRGRRTSAAPWRAWLDEGLVAVGLDGDADADIDHLDDVAGPDAARGPAGARRRLGGQGAVAPRARDLHGTVSIPMAGEVESLNASVAAGVALAEIARRRRAA